MSGFLEEGKKVDILVVKVSEFAHMPYYFGVSLFSKVFINQENLLLDFRHIFE